MTPTAPRRVCIAGKNQIAVDALLHLIGRGWGARLSVCPNATDTGRSGWQPSLLRYARALGVEVVTLEQVQARPDTLFLSLEFDRIVRPADFACGRLYNLHFSALPAYRGVYTSALPILQGATHSGVTLHEIDAGVDTGPIVAQRRFDLAPDWTARDLYFRYMQHGFALLRDTFDRLVAAEPPVAVPQPAQGASHHSRRSIDYAHLAIDLDTTAEGIVRQLRAFSFREYQTPVVHGVEIGGWQIRPEPSRQRPGTLLQSDRDGMTLATADHDLRLRRFSAWDWFAWLDGRRSQPPDPADIDLPDRNGWTPLIVAAYAGNVAACLRLLDAGADPNLGNRNGTTPLMYAASGADPAGVSKVLLARGADPLRRDALGRDLASYHPQLTVVREGQDAQG